MEKIKNNSDFGILYDKYYQIALSKAKRKTKTAEDAEDLCQETFLKAFRFFGDYDREMSFETWLMAIMANQSIDSYRKSFQYKMPNTKLISIDEPIDIDGKCFMEICDNTYEPSKIAEMKEFEENNRISLKKMNKKYKDVYNLSKDKSYEEISQILGINIGTVRSRLHRARLVLAGDE